MGCLNFYLDKIGLKRFKISQFHHEHGIYYKRKLYRGKELLLILLEQVQEEMLLVSEILYSLFDEGVL